jgi:hypothetical protein
MITLPVISAVTPVTSVAIGIGLLGETPGTGLAGALAAALAVAVTGAALAFLARSAGQSEPQHQPGIQHQPRTQHQPGTQHQPEAQRPPEAPRLSDLPPWPRRPELVAACRGAVESTS